jgi:predicted O-methyltransferase YrrM
VNSPDVTGNAAKTYETLSTQFERVEGFLKPVEGFALYWLAQYWPGSGRTVEVGSFKGRSTCWLATGCRDGNREKVVAIDHFCGSAENQAGGSHEDTDIVASGSTLGTMRANLEKFGLSEWVDILVGSSAEVSRGWSQPIRLLFIDGDHSYEGALADFKAWSRHVVPYGLVVFHDVRIWPGVTQLFEELRSRETEWRAVGQHFTLGVLERRPHN